MTKTTRRVAVTNQKGGVGKTTTTVNLGAALALCHQRVLICDLDPQCNLTVHVDCDPMDEAPSLYEVLLNRATLDEVVRETGVPGLYVAPASVDLAGAEQELATEVGREAILRNAFEASELESFDFVLVDCPPSLGLLSLNALVACDEVFVPIQAEFFALQGLGKLHEVVQLVQGRLNPRLAITGMVSCRHDPSTKLAKAVLGDIRDHFGEVLLNSTIRRNVKLAEAPSHGRTIFEYDAGSRGAEDYLALAQELLGEVVEPLVLPVRPLEDEEDDESAAPAVEAVEKEVEGGKAEEKRDEPAAAAAPVVDKPVVEPLAADKPAEAKKPVAKKQVEKKPVVKPKAAAAKAVKQKAPRKPVAKKPAAQVEPTKAREETASAEPTPAPVEPSKAKTSERARESATLTSRRSRALPPSPWASTRKSSAPPNNQQN